MDENKRERPVHDEQELKVIGYCESIGYGRVMQIASEAWKEKCRISAMVVGPCAGLTVPCGCAEPSKCDWCCGSLWLTTKVKKVKDTHEAAEFEEGLEDKILSQEADEVMRDIEAGKTELISVDIDDL